MTSPKRTTKKQAVKKQPPKPAAVLISPSLPVHEVPAQTMIECFCNAATTTSEIVIAPTNIPGSVTQHVVGIMSQTVTTVKNTIKTVAVKIVSKIRSAWNWFTTQVSTTVALVTTAVHWTKVYAVEKAAQAAIISLFCVLYAYGTVCMVRHRMKAISVASWNQSRAWCIALFVSAKTTVIALNSRIRIACVSAKAWAIRTWMLHQPVCMRVAKIGIVTAMLYVLANAVLLSSCLIVAALGVTAYDNACFSLMNSPYRKTIDADRQPQQNPLLFGAA